MTPPKIQALGVTQQWSTTSWKAKARHDILYTGGE
jgi:hypothetical protein